MRALISDGQGMVHKQDPSTIVWELVPYNFSFAAANCSATELEWLLFLSMIQAIEAWGESND